MKKISTHGNVSIFEDGQGGYKVINNKTGRLTGYGRNYSSAFATAERKGYAVPSKKDKK